MPRSKSPSVPRGLLNSTPGISRKREAARARPRRDGLKYHEETEHRVFGAFPDLTMQVDDIFGAGDKVVVRFTLNGTNTGPLFGMPATGRKVVMTGIGIYRFAPHGKIVVEWYENDAIGQMRQLGLLPEGG